MIEIQINDGEKIALEKVGPDLLIDGQKSTKEVIKLDENNFKVFGEKTIFHVQILEKNGNHLIMSVNGKEISMSATSHIDRVLEKLGMDTSSSSSASDIKAPMPGTILALNVEVGATVAKGDSLLILEAMKMENVIKSSGDGTISSIHVKQGDNVEKNQLLISME